MTRLTTSALTLWAAAAMFVGSGFSALAFQTVLNKYFSFIFGVSAYAAATVLAAFMSGLAVGSYLLGRLASSRIRRHFLWYGVLELAIGLYALGFIAIASQVDQWYTPLAREHQFSLRALTGVRFISAFVLVGIPATMMGGTLPLLVEGLKRLGLKSSVNVLYALNVVGAALGTVLSAYVLLPRSSLPGVLQVVFWVNAAIFAATAAVQLMVGREREAEQAPAAQPGASALPRGLLALAFFSGFITFANEVFWYHLLGLVVGTSVYAYSIMLFTTLVGMSVGGLWAQRLLAAGMESARLLLLSQMGLALATLACIPFWDRVPELFARLEFVTVSFEAREAIRFLASCLLVLPAAVCAGLTFPVLLFEVEQRSRSVGAALGRLTAVNTVGTVVGSTLTGFFLLSLLGGRKGLFFSALASVLALALIPNLGRPRLLRWMAAGLAAWVGAVVLLPDWNPQRLLSGANIYFGKAHDDFDEVVWQHEDHMGGVTSVIRKGTLLTLLTNGKFQGNNGSETRAQTRFALIPNLFVEQPRRALHIGLGTANTLGVIARFPYQEVDAIELSPDIVYAARHYFADINEGVLDKPQVKLHLEDGRNFLALNRADRKYDLISVGLTSIWFAGAGNLYNDEFYALARANLSEAGVLQQWLQLHHISQRDIAVTIATLRKHFQYVQLWLPGHQGVLIASNRPFTVVEARLEEVKRTFPSEEFFGGDFRTALGELLLTSEQLDAFLADAARQGPIPISTDTNLHLEFSTPRGNALGWNYNENFEALARYSQPDWEALLGSLAERDPSIIWYASLGRANFHLPHSPPWHQTIDQALGLVPDAATRAQLRQGIIQSLARK
jgi:spermidine synthase